MLDNILDFFITFLFKLISNFNRDIFTFSSTNGFYLYIFILSISSYYQKKNKSNIGYVKTVGCQADILKGKKPDEFGNTTTINIKKLCNFGNTKIKSSQNKLDTTLSNTQSIVLNKQLSKEKLLYFEEWQQVIINTVINFNYYPNWQKITNQIKIYYKCNDSVKDVLREWYDTLKLYTPIENLKFIDIELPTNCKVKSDVLNFDYEKKRILKYLEKRNIDEKLKNKNVAILPQKLTKLAGKLLNWTTISHNLSIRTKYTPEAIKPLKDWYQDYYYKLRAKNDESISENSINIIINSTIDFSSIQNAKLVNLVIDFKKTNLDQLLIYFWEEIKNACFEQINDNSVKIYYTNFFNNFTPNVIENSCCLQHKVFNDNLKELLKNFDDVSNLRTFKEYLNCFPGLYSKMVLWAFDNQFPANTKSQKNNHHVMPQFLIDYGFSKKKIQAKFNLVSVSWTIHFLMHFIRFIEYGQLLDYNAVILMRKEATYFSDSSNKNGLLNHMVSIVLKDNFFKQCPEIEKKLKNYHDKQIQYLANKCMSSQVKKILTTHTVWRHIDEYENIDQRFEFTHYAQNPENCSTKLLANIINAYNKINETLSLKKRLTYNLNVNSNIRKYLTGYKNSTHVYGFYIVDSKPPIAPFIKKK